MLELFLEPCLPADDLRLALVMVLGRDAPVVGHPREDARVDRQVVTLSLVRLGRVLLFEEEVEALPRRLRCIKRRVPIGISPLAVRVFRGVAKYSSFFLHRFVLLRVF